MLSAKPPLMLPVLEMPAALWEKLPRRVGTATIITPALAIYGLFVLASWIFGDYGYLQEQARVNDDLYSVLLAKWVPAALLWTLVLPAMAVRRTAWSLSGICVAAALYIPTEVVPFEAFWWIAGALLLSWAIVTSLPSAMRLVKLAQFSHRERRKASVQLVPVRRAETRRRFSDGLLRSWSPIWMLPLVIFSAVVQLSEYLSMRDSAEPREIAWEFLGFKSWSATGPVFLIGGAIWCLVGLSRMMIERLVGNVVWLLPEKVEGPLQLLPNTLDDAGSCTPNEEVITPDPVECPRLSPGKMWLGYTGSDSEGHLLHWDQQYLSDHQELVRHRCVESTMTEIFSGIGWLEGRGTKISQGAAPLLNS